MKTVLVTGASSGIGKATAEKLLDEGYSVYASARRVERMRDLEERGATALAMDVTVDADMVRVVDRIAEERGGVDALVNNAGFGLYGAMEDTPLEDARYQFEVNLFGLARITQLVLPYMREQRAGTIVNMSSMGGRIYTPLGSWYHASKHALEGWSDCLRLELKSFGIDVVVIQPGIIGTEFGDLMIDPMLERSGDGPYAELTQAMAAASRTSYQPERSSSPSVIADVVAKALAARRPKTRYAAGRMAKLSIWGRKWLGDRIFDRFVMSQV